MTGDYGTTKAELQLSALAGMTVCSQNELQAIASGTGPDVVSGAPDPTHTAIAEGASASRWLFVTAARHPPSQVQVASVEILAAETASGGATVNAFDGSPIGAICSESRST